MPSLLRRLDAALRRLHHSLPRPLWRVSAAAVDLVRRARLAHEARLERRRAPENTWQDRLADVSRPVRKSFVALPAASTGLDLTPGEPVRPNAVQAVDPADLPFVESSFDYVWCGEALATARVAAAVAAEIVRVVRPGGLVFARLPAGEPGTAARALLRPLEETAPPAAAAAPRERLRRALRTLRRVTRSGPATVDAVLRKPGLPPAASRKAPLALYVAPSPRFWEVDLLRTREAVRALRGGGVEVAVVDVDSAARGDAPGARAALAAHPDFTTSINLNYYLGAASGPSSVVRRAGAPTTLIWDDPLGALALVLDARRASAMGDLGSRTGDPLPLFRELMAPPGAQHFSSDSGHIEAMTELGLVERGSAAWYPFPALPAFLEHGRRDATEPRYEVAFCGNVYEAAISRSAFAADPAYRDLADRLCRRKLADLGTSAWDLLQQELDALEPGARESLGLRHEDTAFWDFYVFAVWFAATTTVRLELLGSVPRQVHVFGMFADPASIARLARRPNLVYEGNRHHLRELPATFAATKINLCISQALIFRGLPSKFLECVASGGFALVDHKDDLVRLFGDTVTEVTFRDGDEMNAKIEHFLARPAERRELVAELRRVIEHECTLERVVERVLARRFDGDGAWGRG